MSIRRVASTAAIAYVSLAVGLAWGRSQAEHEALQPATVSTEELHAALDGTWDRIAQTYARHERSLSKSADRGTPEIPPTPPTPPTAPAAAAVKERPLAQVIDLTTRQTIKPQPAERITVNGPMTITLNPHRGPGSDQVLTALARYQAQSRQKHPSSYGRG